MKELIVMTVCVGIIFTSVQQARTADATGPTKIGKFEFHKEFPHIGRFIVEPKWNAGDPNWPNKTHQLVLLIGPARAGGLVTIFQIENTETGNNIERKELAFSVNDKSEIQAFKAALEKIIGDLCETGQQAFGSIFCDAT